MNRYTGPIQTRGDAETIARRLRHRARLALAHDLDEARRLSGAARLLETRWQNIAARPDLAARIAEEARP